MTTFSAQPDDFCLVHGRDHMRTRPGDSISFCQACEGERPTARPEYRFKFAIVDETTGETVWSDFCGLLPDTIDEFGGCEAVDIHVSSMLRGFKRHVRAEYETKNYAVETEVEAAE